MDKIKLLKMMRFKEQLHDTSGWSSCGLWEIIAFENREDYQVVTIRRIGSLSPVTPLGEMKKYSWDFIKEYCEYVKIVPV